MKIDRIKYTHESPFLKEWIGAEAVLEEGDDHDECYRKLKQTVKSWSLEGMIEPASVNFVGPREIKVDKTPEEERKRSLREDIMSCHDLENLESFKLLAKASPELQEAYEFMFKKLTLKEL